jgi:hypothetical protein
MTDERVEWDTDRDDVIINNDDLVVSLQECRRMMRHPDPYSAQYWRRLWLGSWAVAIRRVQVYNCRRLLDWLLDTGEPVPADIARQLMGLKGPPNRPPAIRETPDAVVRRVRRAILDGHRFDSTDDSAACNPAFVAVAEQLGCSPGTVERYYDQCPQEVRDYIKSEEEAERRLIESVKDLPE